MHYAGVEWDCSVTGLPHPKNANCALNTGSNSRGDARSSRDRRSSSRVHRPLTRRLQPQHPRCQGQLRPRIAVIGATAIVAAIVADVSHVGRLSRLFQNSHARGRSSARRGHRAENHHTDDRDRGRPFCCLLFYNRILSFSETSNGLAQVLSAFKAVSAAAFVE